MLCNVGSKRNRFALLFAVLFAYAPLRSMGDEPVSLGSAIPYVAAAVPDAESQRRTPLGTGGATNADETALVSQDDEISVARNDSNGPDFFQSDSDLSEGLVIKSGDSAIQLGGYVKADFIYDFNAIGSKDAFDPLTIPTDGRTGHNTRFHARQTRLNLDFRPGHDCDDLQMFVEGDFFGDGDSFRLRHAYIRAGRLLAGQTWSTFMDESILPDTLDFESPRSILLDRRALLRWTNPVTDFLSVSFALEDPQPRLDLAIAPVGGDVERPAPDLVSRFRYETPRGHLQAASLVRWIGFREASGAQDEAVGWGFNFTGSFRPREIDRVLFQVAFGEGYESYRQGTDGAVDATGVIELNPVLAWVVGYEVEWTDRLFSTFVYGAGEGTAASFEPPSTAEAADYLAANLVFQPRPRLAYGIEYLYGSRTDKDFATGQAHRLQFSVRYDLP